VLGLLNSDKVDVRNHVLDRCTPLTREYFDHRLKTVSDSKREPSLGWILATTTRMVALRIATWDISQPRAVAVCQLIESREQHPFWGWNRAKHSLLELAVLVSRVHMLERTVILEELAKHKIIVEKTAGPSELAAFELIETYLTR
jgi:hypothetical protein